MTVNGKVTGSADVSMIGAGTLRLNADNSTTLSSNFNVAAGTLGVVGNLALGTGDVNLNGGNLSVLWDGTAATNGGTPETLTVGNTVIMNTTAATITVGRSPPRNSPR